MKMVKCYLKLSIFTVNLKNRNIFSKIRRSKVTDYAALKGATIKVKNMYQHISLKSRPYEQNKKRH